jgi:CDGSH-type Zn-finger protein
LQPGGTIVHSTRENSQGQNKPTIEPTVNGPYLVKNLTDFKNSRGESIATKPGMRLCRCGGSANKPFCDNTHLVIGFLHDNRGVCSHAGYCTDNSPAVFKMGSEPWIYPDADDSGKTAKTIKMCPSGALSYTKDRILYKDQERAPAITVSKDGPYRAVGGPELKDPAGNKPESKEHYALCRCGASKNKPFCSGQHWHIGFKDDKN